MAFQTLLVVLFTWFGSPLPVEEAAAFTGFALVELYTSQGCSSCPPADRVLAQLVEEARQEDLPLYALSFHVDYWNRLGWADPYSDPAYSRRQRAYAHVLNERVYTPQMIVNGREVFVGSRAETARRAVEKHLRQEALSQIRLIRSEDAGNVRVLLNGKTEGITLRYAWVDAQKSNPVPRGENAGRQLTHVQVVRELGVLDHTGEPPTLELTDRIAEGSELIVFSQDRETWQVYGAARIAF